jgi:uncharacterized SAM-binding protein YcdF (DUF218 family)
MFALSILFVVGMIVAVALLAAAIHSQARNDETAPADAIVVLGAAQWNGRPSATLRARLDHALSLYQQGLAPFIVLTGGQGVGDQFSEAEVSAEYLFERGVPRESMATVGGSTSWTSLQEAGQVLSQRSIRDVLMVSDPFHMFRVKRMADDLGLEPLGSPTQTSPIREASPLEYRYMAREVFAYLAYLFLER